MLWMRSAWLIALALQTRLRLLLGGVVDVRANVDFRECRHQVGQHERFRFVGVEEVAALFGKVSFLRTLVDREEQLFLQSEKFLLARVGMEGQARPCRAPCD